MSDEAIDRVTVTVDGWPSTAPCSRHGLKARRDDAGVQGLTTQVYWCPEGHQIVAQHLSDER